MYNKGSFNISIKKNPPGPSKGKHCDPRCEWLTRGTDRPALGITLILCGQERKTAQCSWLTFPAHPIMFKIPEWCVPSAPIWTTAPFSMMKERTECGKPAWEIYVLTKKDTRTVKYYSNGPSCQMQVLPHRPVTCTHKITSHACKSTGPKFVLLGKTSTPRSDQFNS